MRIIFPAAEERVGLAWAGFPREDTGEKEKTARNHACCRAVLEIRLAGVVEIAEGNGGGTTKDAVEDQARVAESAAKKAFAAALVATTPTTTVAAVGTANGRVGRDEQHSMPGFGRSRLSLPGTERRAIPFQGGQVNSATLKGGAESAFLIRDDLRRLTLLIQDGNELALLWQSLGVNHLACEVAVAIEGHVDHRRLLPWLCGQGGSRGTDQHPGDGKHKQTCSERL